MLGDDKDKAVLISAVREFSRVCTSMHVEAPYVSAHISQYGNVPSSCLDNFSLPTQHGTVPRKYLNVAALSMWSWTSETRHGGRTHTVSSEVKPSLTIYDVRSSPCAKPMSTIMSTFFSTTGNTTRVEAASHSSCPYLVA